MADILAHAKSSSEWSLKEVQHYIFVNNKNYDQRLNAIRDLLLFAEGAIVFTHHRRQLEALKKARAARNQRKKSK